MEKAFTKDTVQHWYLTRTTEMEKLSGLVNLALKFGELAIANGCRNMSEMVEHLRTLFTLIYECQKCVQTYYTLEYIADLNELERLSLIMSHSFETASELYGKNLQSWLVPFVSRRPTVCLRETLLRDYFLKVSCGQNRDLTSRLYFQD